MENGARLITMADMHKQDIVAVILAGGLGKRIQHLLPDIPKPMAPVAGRPCLEWLVRYLVKEGVNRVVISSGYKADVIEKYFAGQPVLGARVRCVTEPEPLGTGGGLVFAVRASGERPAGWVVLNGDTFAFAELKEALTAMEDRAVDGVVFGREVADTSRYGSLVLNGRGNLVLYEEKRPGRGLVSAGVSLLRAELVERFPEERPMSLERDAFPALTRSGAFLKVLTMNAPFLDIGTPESLPQAEGFVRANLGRFALE